MVTKLINTTGTLAEFATILWPEGKERKRKAPFEKVLFCVIGTLQVYENPENMRDSAFHRWVISFHGP